MTDAEKVDLLYEALADALDLLPIIEENLAARGRMTRALDRVRLEAA